MDVCINFVWRVSSNVSDKPRYLKLKESNADNFFFLYCRETINNCIRVVKSATLFHATLNVTVRVSRLADTVTSTMPFTFLKSLMLSLSIIYMFAFFSPLYFFFSFLMVKTKHITFRVIRI